MQAIQPLLRVLALFRAQSTTIALGIVAALASLLAGVALMAGAGHYIAASALGVAIAVPVFLEVIGVARVVLRYLERLVTHNGTFRALAALRIWFYRGLAHSAAGGLGYRRAGDILARLVNDIEALDGILLRIVIPLLSAIILIPILLVVTLPVAPVASMIVLALFLSVAFVLPWRALHAARAAADAEAQSSGALRTAMLDALTGLREIKIFGAEGTMLATVQSRDSVRYAAERSLSAHSGIMQAAAFLATQAAILTLLLTPFLIHDHHSIRVIHDHHSIRVIHDHHPITVVIAIFVIIAAFEAIAGMPRAGIIAGRAAAGATRVLHAAQTPPTVSDPTLASALPAGTSLSFDAIDFRWTPQSPPLFTTLTLDIPPGSRIAVLGPSGAGKSTLAALALKLAAPQSGRICLGGTDIATLAASDLHTRITWLAQATHLFADTIRNNLRLAVPDADDATLWHALEAARLADTVRALPDQLDTWIGENATLLSGGQGRRLALARTLLSPAPILILDEPCAGLDRDTERQFMSTINETLAGRSLLLITHRLTGIERLDRVFRLQNGRLTAAAG